MQLSMTVLRCPDQVAPEARTVSGGEFHVGRGPDVDWVLPDPDRLLSKRHFAVAFRGGGWQVADTSTNGTFLNAEPDPIGRGTARSLRDGDRLRLGAYELEIRVVDQPSREADRGMGQPAGPGRDGGGFGGGGSGQSPFGDPFAEDLLAPPPPPRRAFDEPAYRDLNVPPTGAQLPHDFDPLAPDHDDAAFGDGFRGPVQSDHSSSMDDAMIPPPISGYTAPGHRRDHSRQTICCRTTGTRICWKASRRRARPRRRRPARPVSRRRPRGSILVPRGGRRPRRRQGPPPRRGRHLRRRRPEPGASERSRRPTWRTWIS